MLVITLSSLLLIALTTLIHFELLQRLNVQLPVLKIPKHSRVLVAVLGLFFAHALEVVIYGAATFGLVRYFDVGHLESPEGLTLAAAMHFSAETYTSLGIGDIKPVGPVRMIAGVEALHGLLLIGWSASYLYITMERFWSAKGR